MHVVKYIFAILIFMISLQHISELKNIIVVDDELGYWGIAAYMAGHDWSGVLSQTGYYSYGYAFLLFPLFYLFKQSSIIYQSAIVLNACMLVISFFLAAYSLKKLFKEVKPFFIDVICFVTILYTNNIAQAQIAWSEVLLSCLFWMLFFLFVLLLQKVSMVRILMIASVTTYLYMVHMRSIGVVIAICIIMLILFLNKTICAKQFCIFIVSLLFGLMLANGIKVYFQEVLWNNSESIVGNDYAGQVSKVKGLFSGEAIIALFQSVCGKVYYILGASILLVGSGMYFCTCLVMNYLVYPKQYSKEKMNKAIIFLFLLLSVLAELFISAIATYGLSNRIDVLIYGRYIEFVLNPLIAIGFIAILTHRISKEYCWISILFFLCTLAILPSYNLVKGGMYNIYCAFGLNYFFRYEDGWTRDNALIGIGVLIFFLGSLVILVARYKKWIALVLALCICMLFWQKNTEYAYQVGSEGWNIRFEEQYQPIAEVIHNRKLETIDYIYTKDIVEDVHINNRTYLKQIQFMLYDVKINMIEENVFEKSKGKNDRYYLVETDSPIAFAVKKNLEVVMENKIFILLKDTG